MKFNGRFSLASESQLKLPAEDKGPSEHPGSPEQDHPPKQALGLRFGRLGHRREREPGAATKGPLRGWAAPAPWPPAAYREEVLLDHMPNQGPPGQALMEMGTLQRGKGASPWLTPESPCLHSAAA